MSKKSNKIAQAQKREISFTRSGQHYKFVVYHALRNSAFDNFFTLVNGWIGQDSPKDGPSLVAYLTSIGEQAWTRSGWEREMKERRRIKSKKRIADKLLSRYESVRTT